MALLTKEWSVLFQWFVSTVPRKYIPLLNAPAPFVSLPSASLPCPSLFSLSLCCLHPPFLLPSFFLSSPFPSLPFLLSPEAFARCCFLVFFISCSFTDLDYCKGLWSCMVLAEMNPDCTEERSSKKGQRPVNHESSAHWSKLMLLPRGS